MAFASNTILLLCLIALAVAKPIMVTFGTHQGPIEPPPEAPQKPAARAVEGREPAPVNEEVEDVPDTQPYRPPMPRQYKDKISLLKSLLFPDRKYPPGDAKYEVYKKEERIVPAVEFTGPHVFEKQEYEIIQEKKNRQQQVSYIKPHYYEQKLKQQENQKAVPGIGVVYSAGIKYYVPQLLYVDPRDDEEQENSVYDSPNEKYLPKRQ